ncbi:MAG: DUF4249 domain-containing protein [Dyadobacter sp.]|uniref:DUF4249 domain-containing protein n=1 Tax=Dyadobacter sp. TaxID=1914288 RepID=UPI003263741D
MYSCIEPFSPPEVNSDENYLVIDGFLNVGNDTSKIELRRTQNINQNVAPIIEIGAKLTVEQETGEKDEFMESGKGLYFLPPKQYNRAGKYRLRIKTQDGEEYLSEYVTVNVSPVIDSLTYKVDPVQNTMVFYVNTHDSQSKTQFYRWKFEETWEYRSAYATNLEVINDEVVTRTQDINRCWGNKKSGSILLGSTVKLTSDVIKNLPLNIVPISTNKLYIKYSILVKQYGLSRQAFEYWTSLSKTTQGTGSLFDPQPSQVTGNIFNTADSKKLAFGYFSASTQETKRIIIEPNLGTYPRCIAPDTLPIACSERGVDCATTTSQLLLNYYGMRSDSVLVSPSSCADCRTGGGTTNRPSFW